MAQQIGTLGTLTSHIGVPGSSLSYSIPLIQVPACGDANTWAPTTYVEGLNRAPSSWLRPGQAPGVATIREVTQKIEICLFVTVSLCLSNK